MLLGISSIVLLIIGITGGMLFVAALGLICFIVILILRAKQIKDMNLEIKHMKESDQYEADDPENK